MPRTNFDAATRKSMADLAEIIAQDISVAAAGRTLGLTNGQTANAWRNIKAEMGEQAA